MSETLMLAPTAASLTRAEAKRTVTKVRMQGNRAFVVFDAPGAILYMPMTREGGRWRAALLAAAVLIPAR
jgi:hypothetical protein